MTASKLPKTEIEFIEYVEQEYLGSPAILPRVVRINGSRVLVERDSVEILHGDDDRSALGVRLTLLPSRLEFKTELESD